MRSAFIKGTGVVDFDEAEKILKGPGIAVITIEQANELAAKHKEQSMSEVLGEVKMKALIAYAELLRKKHPNWKKEKVLKKSAELYNIKLVK